MKRTIALAATLLALTGCAAVRDLTGTRSNPYEKDPFYVKYLDTGSALDARIREALENVRREPASPQFHNELGALLVDKGFPKDAEREFERAVDQDRKYYQGWYNLGLIRAARGDEPGAHRALRRAIDLKPGHAPALFQLGLIEENRRHVDRAVTLYAKAFRINPALLEVEVNPRILDSNLTHLALLRAYPAEHARRSMQLQDAPIVRETMPAPSTGAETLAEAPSDQPAPARIVTPAPPPTDRSMQQTPSDSATSGRARARRRRPRRIEPPAPQQEPPAPSEPVQIEEETPPFEPPPVTDAMTADEPESEESEEEEAEQTGEEPPPPPPPGR